MDEIDVAVRAEALSVLSAMRLSTGRWMAQLRFEQEIPPELEQPIVQRLRSVGAGEGQNLHVAVQPFVEVIASPHAHAPVLHATAASLGRFVALLRASGVDDGRAVAVAIAGAVAQRLGARVAAGDAATSESVVLRLAALLVQVMPFVDDVALERQCLDGGFKALLDPSGGAQFLAGSSSIARDLAWHVGGRLCGTGAPASGVPLTSLLVTLAREPMTCVLSRGSRARARVH